MCPYPNQQAARSGVPSAANDNGGSEEADRAVVLSVVVELARLLAQHEVDRRHAANDNGGEVPAA
jgi:hypothetical protein